MTEQDTTALEAQRDHALVTWATTAYHALPDAFVAQHRNELLKQSTIEVR
jgi:hypothetical protein